MISHQFTDNTSAITIQSIDNTAPIFICCDKLQWYKSDPRYQALSATTATTAFAVTSGGSSNALLMQLFLEIL